MCDVIKCSCDVIHTEYDVIQSVCGIIDTLCFNDINTVDVVSDIVGEMADITFVLSCA